MSTPLKWNPSSMCANEIYMHHCYVLVATSLYLINYQTQIKQSKLHQLQVHLGILPTLTPVAACFRISVTAQIKCEMRFIGLAVLLLVRTICNIDVIKGVNLDAVVSCRRIRIVITVNNTTTVIWVIRMELSMETIMSRMDFINKMGIVGINKIALTTNIGDVL